MQTPPILLLAVALSGQSAGDRAASAFVTSRVERRVVKTFQFEKDKSNFTNVPMNWCPLRRPGFLRHNEAAFDEAVGHTDAPSLKLAFDRGGVGTWYRSKDIDVHPGNDYRVSAWIRPLRLERAGAYFTAFFMDHAFRKIEASERRSRVIRGAGPAEPWTEVTVDLTGGFAQARWIGITCVIEQPPPHECSNLNPRPINRDDVNGAAWFDDIIVARLPEVTLELQTPSIEQAGNVFAADEPIVVRASVIDPYGADLTSNLDIVDRSESIVLTFGVPTAEVRDTDMPYDVSSLVPGRYEARLTIRTGNQRLLQRTQSFLKLGPDSCAPRTGPGFGVVLEPSIYRAPKTIGRLVRLLSPGTAKVPFWHKELSDRSIVYGDPALSSMLYALESAGTDPVGTIVGPPKSLASAAGAQRSLLDVLTDASGDWRPYLSLVLARYGPEVQSWQLGGDDNTEFVTDSRFPNALETVQSELVNLINDPRLAFPASPLRPIEAGRLPADVVSLSIPQHLSQEQAASAIGAVKKDGARRCWAVINALDSRRYDRRSRLAQFAQRIITARANGAEVVFVRQPWTLDTSEEPTIDPVEEFQVLRTLSRSLAGLTEVGPVWIDHGVTAFLFENATGDEGAVATWLTADEGAARNVSATVGPVAVRIALLADAQDTAASSGPFSLDSMPVVLSPVVPWIVRMQSSFTLDNADLAPAIKRQRRSISLKNSRRSKIHGILRLAAPAGVEISPRRMTVDLEPGQTFERELTVGVAANYPAGRYDLEGRFEIAETSTPALTLRTPLYIANRDLDVGVLAHVEDGDLLVTQRITNKSNETMQLRAFVIASGHPRDTTIIPSLPPGQTAIRKYRVTGAPTLGGGFLRVTAEQTNGPAIHNYVMRFD